jgi:hypothetical protein
MICPIRDRPDSERTGRHDENATDWTTLRYVSVKETDEDRSTISFRKVDKTFDRSVQRRAFCQFRIVSAE